MLKVQAVWRLQNIYGNDLASAWCAGRGPRSVSQEAVRATDSSLCSRLEKALRVAGVCAGVCVHPETREHLFREDQHVQSRGSFTQP